VSHVTELQKWANELLEEEYGYFLSLAIRMVGVERANDVMSEVVFKRLPGILNTWDPSIGTPVLAHCNLNLKWYMYKYLQAQDKLRSFHVQWDDEQVEPSETYIDELESGEILQCLEQKLSRFDNWLLLEKDVHGIPIDVIARECEVSRNTAYQLLNKARLRARVILQETFGGDIATG
jgi:DNA-directed RNA polymerase specialized sigma24 family protein